LLIVGIYTAIFEGKSLREIWKIMFENWVALYPYFSWNDIWNMAEQKS
jgi:hypothetical protein